MYPSSRSDEIQDRSCYTCQATDHWTMDCPRGNPSLFEQIWGNNRWQQTDSSPWGQQQFDSSFGPSVGTPLHTLEDEKHPDAVLELLQNMTALISKMQESTAQDLDAHMTRIAKLERAKLGSDQIIEEQAKRIEALEDIVKKFETQLKHQQQDQIQHHEANLRRIKQIHLEVPRLREQLVRVDSQMCRVQQEQAQYLHSNYREDSSDEEDLGVITTHESLCVRDEQASTSNTKEEPVEPELLVTAEEVRATRAAQFKFLTKYLARPGVDINNANVSAMVDFVATLKDRIAADCETSELQVSLVKNPVSECEAGIPCNDCGLHCTHQLRACVNMIHVMPSVSKVKEKEIQALKRRMKRKLQRIWVPRGVFEVKEFFTVDTSISEDQCAKSYMPRWKKRKRRTPAPSDTHD